MLTLEQTATLYRCEGQRNGAPAYAPEGEVLRCRIQPEQARTTETGGLGLERSALVFIEPATVQVGDRLVTADGCAMQVVRVVTVNGFGGAHHMEIEVSDRT